MEDKLEIVIGWLLICLGLSAFLLAVVGLISIFFSY